MFNGFQNFYFYEKLNFISVYQYFEIIGKEIKKSIFGFYQEKKIFMEEDINNLINCVD